VQHSPHVFALTPGHQGRRRRSADTRAPIWPPTASPRGSQARPNHRAVHNRDAVAVRGSPRCVGVDTKIVGAATLAVLALLAGSGLASRHQVDEVRATLDQIASDVSGEVPADRFLSARIPSLDDEVATASDIRLVGVTLTRTVRDLLPAFDGRLRKGASVRVVVIDKDSPARTEAVARSVGASSPHFYQHRLSATIDLLGVLAATTPNASAFEVRVLPFVPTFGMCLIDPSEAHGRIFIEVYQHKTVEQNPSFCLRADPDGDWYQLFIRQFDTLWDSARALPLPPSQEQP
jgi:hypothetical protein